ncbi:hypothetical protein BH09PSE3_BH09PSE3_15650 [soil metagenome]
MRNRITAVAFAALTIATGVSGVSLVSAHGVVVLAPAGNPQTHAPGAPVVKTKG